MHEWIHTRENMWRRHICLTRCFESAQFCAFRAHSPSLPCPMNCTTVLPTSKSVYWMAHSVKDNNKTWFLAFRSQADRSTCLLFVRLTKPPHITFWTARRGTVFWFQKLLHFHLFAEMSWLYYCGPRSKWKINFTVYKSCLVQLKIHTTKSHSRKGYHFHICLGRHKRRNSVYFLS